MTKEHEQLLHLIRELRVWGENVGAYQALGTARAMKMCLAAERKGDNILAEIEQLVVELKK